MKNANITELHAALCERLSEVTEAIDSLFEAADAAAAAAEDDPTMTAYLESILPLMSLWAPTAPPPPTA